MKRHFHRWIGLLGLLLFLPWIGSMACRPSAQVVVLYTSQDLAFAEPLLRAFTRESGIQVRTLYDSEAVKTVGLANRLLAERSNPQCDVFWSNEELRARQLEKEGVFEPESLVTLGHRRRYLVYNTNKVQAADLPQSLRELTTPAWRGKVVCAYPLFGTTTAHFLALRERWGEKAWADWCQAMQQNRTLLVDGNSVVVQWVGRGEAWVGLTDSDDWTIGKKNQLPIDGRPLAADGLAIANTVAQVRGSPHPEAARKLMAYLGRRDVLQELVRQAALEGVETLPGGVEDWARLLAELQPSLDFLKKTFLR